MENSEKRSTLLSNVRAGEKVRIIDEAILTRFPRLKDRELICSVIKKSGARLFFQYFSPQTGSGTLKLVSNPLVEIVSKEDILTLAQFLKNNRYKQERPAGIVLNINGELGSFAIAEGFWEQNPSNIKLRFVKQYGSNYSVPGSSIVNQVLAKS